jgi:REP element-mobilizing transposase RayT
MSRPLRIDLAGSCYHVTARGNERRDIYRDEIDRLKFLALLAEQSERFWLRPWCYVLMDNHYHPGVETGEPNLSRAMQWLNVSIVCGSTGATSDRGTCSKGASRRCWWIGQVGVWN